MTTGMEKLAQDRWVQQYLAKLDAREVLDHYSAQNVSEQPGENGTTELIHSCLIERVEPHHTHGDANPSAALNVEKRQYVCIAPGAWVMTPEGGKPIEDLVVGDLVLTHRGRYRPVTKTYSRHIDDEVIEYRPAGSRSFLITKDHRMLTAPRGLHPGATREFRGARRRAEVGVARWYPGQEIEGHVVVRGRLTETIDVERVRVQEGPIHPRNNVRVEWVDVTSQLMRLVGYYLAEGDAHRNGVQFSLNPQEAHYADDIELLLKECFGVSAVRLLARGGLYVRVASRGLSKFFVRQFGTGCDRKILPSWVMTLPTDKQRDLLLGLYRGDGSVSGRDFCSVLALANPALVYQVWQLLSRFGAKTSLEQIPSKPFSINGYTGMSRPQGRIRWSDDCSGDYRYVNDKARSPFRDRPPAWSKHWVAKSGESCVSATWKLVSYRGLVYDVEVAEDHSFVVEGVVSSNCYAGGWHGNLFHLIMKLEGKDSFSDALLGVSELFHGGPSEATEFQAELKKVFTAPGAYAADLSGYSESVLNGFLWPTIHPYLAERGITQEVADFLKLGYDERENRVVFPHFFREKLVGFQKRVIPARPGEWPGTDPDFPKYRSSSGFPKAETLYGYDFCRLCMDTMGVEVHAIVVESPFSVAKAYSLNLPFVVATFGAKVTENQISLLTDFASVTIWFDDDEAGRAGERRILESLAAQKRLHTVRVVTPDPGKDLGDYDTTEQVQQKLAQATPGFLKLAEYDAGRSRGAKR